MRYQIVTYSPLQTPPRDISFDELTGLYVADHEPVFTYGDDRGDVLIVSLDERFSTVSLEQDDTWYWLVESSGNELVEITLCGMEAWLPRGALVRPETGLAVLRQAHDVPRLLTAHTWIEQL